MDVATTLGPKLALLFFQLPPNFKKDTGRLADLLVRLPGRLRAAFEFRHESWFSEDVLALLRTRDAALCLADTERGTTPDEATASWGYLRLRDTAYSDGDLERWVERIERHRWQDAYVYFKHEETGRATTLALRFQELTRHVQRRPLAIVRELSGSPPKRRQA